MGVTLNRDEPPPAFALLPGPEAPPIPRRTWTNEQKSAAVAQHVAGRGVTEIAADLQTSQSNVSRWVAESETALSATLGGLSSDTKREIAEAAQAVVRSGIAIVAQSFARFATMELTPQQTKEVSISTGIMRDVALDYLDGRRGMDITVDARSVVGLPIGMNADEARALADALSPPDQISPDPLPSIDISSTPTEDDH